MKTIKITDAAYDHLVKYRHGSKVTFSQVVLKFVPQRGTAADLLNIIRQMPPLDDAAHQKMLEVYEDHRR